MNLLTTEEAFGHTAELFREIREIGLSDTPFFSMISTGAPKDRAAGAYFGHSWKFMNIPDGDDTNEHEENGVPADPEKHLLGGLTNHYQIIKNTYGVSGSEDAGEGIDGKKELARQLAMTTAKHRKTIEKALLSDLAPVQRNKVANIKGRMGGIKHFLNADTDLDTGGADLKWQTLRELLKIGYMNGSPYKIIMMSDTQKDKLDDILWDKSTNTNMASTELENNVVKIKNTAYGNGISVVLNPFLSDSEIMGFTPANIFAVLWRPTKTYDIARTTDGIAKELITEMTLRMEHTYAAARLKNLKTT